MSDSIDEMVSRSVNLSFSRSGGSGGQNVNKVNTKVTARLAIEDLHELSKVGRDRLRERLANRINTEDELVIQVQQERDQLRNREIAIRRMSNLIRHALERRKARKPTKPSRGARERRLQEKKQRSQTKRDRREPKPD